mgnify:FL=1
MTANIEKLTEYLLELKTDNQNLRDENERLKDEIQILLNEINK